MPVNTDPTPEQIRDECLLIQQTWTPAEKMRRLRPDLRPHYQRCDGESEEMSSSVYADHHEAREALQA